jgi:hypothetical protein
VFSSRIGWVGPGTRMVSQPSGLIVPAFGDGHVQFSDGGLQLSSVDLRDAAIPGGIRPTDRGPRGHPLMAGIRHSV